jgi:tetratricopeptide (TPR) repeat protein
MHLRTAVLAALLPLAACQPRPPALPVPAPEPLAEPASPEEVLVASLRRARLLFDEGVALSRQSRWWEAAERFPWAAQADPHDPRYPVALSGALAALGRDSEAADALAAAIRIEEGAARPNHRVLYVDYERLIRWLERAGRLDEARAARLRQEHHRRHRDTGS